MRLLFVGGPPRSGTTALINYLNQHPEMLLCNERYKWMPPRLIRPELFTFERILDYRPSPRGDRQETNTPREYHVELLAGKDPKRLKWIGDKTPAYVKYLGRLSENNPGASFILTYRPLEDVAESFEARSNSFEDPWLLGGFKTGVEQWNAAMKSTRDFIKSARNLNVLILSYHDFFYDNEAIITSLSRFLDIEIDQKMLDAWREMSRSFEADRRPKEPLSEEQRAYIEANKDEKAERWVLNRIRQQRQELKLYSPEAARALAEERRLSAVRIAQERARSRSMEQAVEELGRFKAGGSVGIRREGVPIFFVVGRPRSGTTWLRKMLDQHPEVLCHGEGRFFGRDDKDPNFENVRVNSKGQVMRPGSLHYTLGEYENLRIWLERTWWSRDGDVDEHIACLTREAVHYFLARKLSETDKRIAGDKTPLQSAQTVSEIASMFPEAKVIHIIRDGRDQAVSHAHHRWNKIRPVEEGGQLTLEEQDKRNRYRENPEEFVASRESIFSEERLIGAAKGWSSQVGTTHRDGPSVLGDGYTEVYYEDLLERPEEEMGRLFCFLGARDNERIIHQCVEKNRFEKVARRQAGSEDSASFLRKGVAGDWRSVFTERDKAIYKEIAGDLLIELGYEKDNYW